MEPMEGLWTGDGAHCSGAGGVGRSRGQHWASQDGREFCNPSKRIPCRGVGESARGGAGTAKLSSQTQAPCKARGIPEPSITWQDPQADPARHHHKEKVSSSGATSYLEIGPFL